MKALLVFFALIGTLFFGAHHLIMTSSKPLVRNHQNESTDDALRETAKFIADKPHAFKPQVAGVEISREPSTREPSSISPASPAEPAQQRPLIGGFKNFDQFQQQVSVNAMVTFQDMKQVWVSLGTQINSDRIDALEMTKRIGLQTQQNEDSLELKKEVAEQLLNESAYFRSDSSTEAIEYSGRALSAYLEVERDPDEIKRMCAEKSIPVLDLDQNPNPSP